MTPLVAFQGCKYNLDCPLNSAGVRGHIAVYEKSSDNAKNIGLLFHCHTQVDFSLTQMMSNCTL